MHTDLHFKGIVSDINSTSAPLQEITLDHDIFFFAGSTNYFGVGLVGWISEF